MSPYYASLNNTPPPHIANFEQIGQGQFLLTLTDPLGATVVL